MGAKRGASGLSLVVGVDKPLGMSSHDVVNRCRRIFGERRVGHTGTLDPMASGALIICVGPATRLDAYLDADTKAYAARVVFGQATDTDDAEGTAIATAPVPPGLFGEAHARRVLADLVGPHSQMPPQYSAIKVNGVKGYEAARRGGSVELQPRDIRIFEAELLGLGTDEQGRLYWDARFAVSKGTYIRSIARDLGKLQGTAAYLGGLRRQRCGKLDVADCVTLEQLEADPACGYLDPVRLVGRRVLFADERQAALVGNGAGLRVPDAGLELFRPVTEGAQEGCQCIPLVRPDLRPLDDGEIISVVSDNKLVALYAFDRQRGRLSSRCVFAQGVIRGSHL